MLYCNREVKSLETFERIRFLRKQQLKLTQEQFGEQLGVSRTVIKNIELGALARPEQKEPLYRLICEKFHVSYKWLTSGEGEMFVTNAEDDSLDALLQSRNVPADDLEIIKSVVSAFLELQKPSRDAVVEFVRKCAEKLNSSDTAAPAGEVDVVAELNEVKRQNEELRTRLEAIEKEDEEAKKEKPQKASKKKAF